jgi:hypothetical protein
MSNKLEHIVNAIAKLNGLLDPTSDAYRLKNPLLLRSFAMIGKHQVDPEGRRVFESVLNGLKAAMFDIELKASGKSRANAGPDSSLEEFLKCYQINTSLAVDHIVSFLRRALNDQNISKHTLISYFTEDPCQTEQ